MSSGRERGALEAGVGQVVRGVFVLVVGVGAVRHHVRADGGDREEGGEGETEDEELFEGHGVGPFDVWLRLLRPF